MESALRPSADALLGFTADGETRFNVAATCLQVLRRLCTNAAFYPGLELYHIMHALIGVLADAELHKRILAQIIAHERQKLNKASNEDFPILKLREMRETAIDKSLTLRCLAGDIFLIFYRRCHQRAPLWRESFYGRLFEVLEPPEPKLEPLYHRPTPPAITLLGLEGILLCLHKTLPQPTKLTEDAQRQVFAFSLPVQNLVALENGERLGERCVLTLMELNVQLPADPYGPLTSLCDQDDVVFLGHDFGLSANLDVDELDECVIAHGKNPMHETQRLLAQSEECLKWNAALLLYKLGLMGAKLWPQNFMASMSQWKQKSKEARYLIAEDIFRRIPDFK